MILIEDLKKRSQNIVFFLIAIIWLKNMQTLQGGGVLETSEPPLDDGHRDFEDAS